MLALTSGEYTALFTGLTALFGGVVAIVMYMGYRHGRHQAGMRQPIRVSNEKYWHPDELKIFEWPRAIIDTRSKQFVLLRFYNRTDVDIRWSIDGNRTRIFGTTVGNVRPTIDDPGMIETRRHDGTSVGLIFVFDDDWHWKRFGDNEPEKRTNKLGRKFWIRVRGHTADGHKIKAWKHVEVFRYYPDDWGRREGL